MNIKTFTKYKSNILVSNVPEKVHNSTEEQIISTPEEQKLENFSNMDERGSCDGNKIKPYSSTVTRI